MSAKELDEILSKYDHDSSYLISILQDVQERERYLPQDILRGVAEKLNIPLTRVYSVASFFTAFSLEPRGRYTIKVCLGTACHVRGAPKVLEKLERDLGIKPGETTPDLMFTLETVNCLGACALGPVVVVGNEYFGQMNSAKVDKLLAACRKQCEDTQQDADD